MSVSNSEDLLDVRDVIERYEELEKELEEASDLDMIETLAEAKEEFETVKKFLDQLEGNGGDHEWGKQWYPVTLVRDSYFEDFARDEAEQLDLIKRDQHWPYNCIDWEQAAAELQSDYSQADFDGVTYWYRN